jgi:hypothetical protein
MRKTAYVVIVNVGEDYRIHAARVDTKLGHITREHGTLAADIEQHGPFRALDIAGKAPPGIQCRIIRIVIINDSKG